MPKMKTHKGIKKRFKVSATGKVSHKRCGSSHLNSHKSGKKIRRLRKKSILKVGADAHRLRRALRTRERVTTRLEIVDGENVTPPTEHSAAPQA
jgi:large subunit ribosomal protein L35